MKYVIQMICHKHGYRSEPFIATQIQLFELLKDSENVDRSDYILTVGYIKPSDQGAIEEEGLQISGNPLITVQTFLEMFDAELAAENAKNPNLDEYQEEQLDIMDATPTTIDEIRQAFEISEGATDEQVDEHIAKCLELGLDPTDPESEKLIMEQAQNA